MAGFFSSLLGGSKLLSNFFGGGSGKSETTNQNQTQTQTGTTDTTSRSAADTLASRREYSDGMLSLIEATTANSILGQSKGQDALSDQVDKIKSAGLGSKAISFDSDAFIRDTMAGADNSLGASLRQNKNQAIASAGGSTAGNSAAALLVNRLESDSAAQRAGILASTTAQGKQLEADLRKANTDELATETSLLSGVDTSMQAGLATLLNALRGGETFQEVNNRETQQQNQTASGTTTTTGTSNTRTPFNWTAGLGNLFKDIGDD